MEGLETYYTTPFRKETWENKSQINKSQHKDDQRSNIEELEQETWSLVHCYKHIYAYTYIYTENMNSHHELPKKLRLMLLNDWLHSHPAIKTQENLY